MKIDDQSGKTAIVTGTGGIAYEIARALSAAGAKVIMAGRNAEKGVNAVSKICEDFPNADIRFEMLDLANQASIDAFCERMNHGLNSLDILMCIAGLMMPNDLQKTNEGVEMQFAVNYLGHFSLVAGLFPLLKVRHGARVITVSSVANRPLRFDLGDATAEHGYSSSISYALSKLACLMFAVELAARSEERDWGIMSFSAHPGFANTRLFSESRHFMMVFFRTVFMVLPVIRQSAKNAARPALFAATSQGAVSGRYYGPFFVIMGPSRRAFIPLRAKNRKLRKALWDLSVSLTGRDIE